MHEEKTPRKYARISLSQWAEIEALWETGGATLENLALEYDLTTRALQTHFSKSGTVKGAKAKEIAVAIKSKIHAEAFEDQETRMKLAKDCSLQGYMDASTLQTMLMSQIDQMSKDPSSALKTSSVIKSISVASQALERLQGVKMKSLGVEGLIEPDELPEIHIRDLNEEELVSIREANGDDEFEAMEADEDEDGGVEIVVVH